MARKNLMEILESSDFDMKEEYTRLYELFFDPIDTESLVDYHSISDLVEKHFLRMSHILTKRCTSLDDFDRTFDFYWESTPKNFDLDYFLTFCEYIYNFAVELEAMEVGRQDDISRVRRIMSNVQECMDIIGYEEYFDDESVSIFVEKKPEALAVAEIVEPELGYKIMEYNHHQLKGDLTAKQLILKMMADDIETERKSLKNINSTLESQLFEMMNKFVRHSHEKTPAILEMSDDKIEEYYDDIYQMWLLAKLELDNMSRKDKIKELLKQINER